MKESHMFQANLALPQPYFEHDRQVHWSDILPERELLVSKKEVW